MKMDLERIRQLIELSKGSRAAEIALETAEGRIRVRRRARPGSVPPAVVEGVAAGAGLAPEARGPALLEAQAEGTMVKSGYVGVFRRGPGVGKPAFVEVGQRVEAGHIIAVVETLDVPNEIASPVAGEVRQVVVEDGAPVEYGQDLVLIAPLPPEADPGRGE